MREEIVLNGIILSTGLVGEYDKRLVILTKERGRITAFARGVRRTTNHLISSSQIFVMGAFTLYEGRDAYTLVNVEAKEYFHELTFDMNKYCYGSYFCEMMSYFTREGEGSADYLNLLFVSLNALKKGLVPVRLIRCIYELKIMDVFGQGLQSWRCPVCGNDKVTGILDIMSGGLLCDDCKDRARHPMILSDDMVYILQYINGAEIGKLFNFNVQESQLEKLESICRSFMDTYVDKKFNSAEIIASLS
jgi:DNA repair protein RecO (recombination protein O)